MEAPWMWRGKRVIKGKRGFELWRRNEILLHVELEDILSWLRSFEDRNKRYKVWERKIFGQEEINGQPDSNSDTSRWNVAFRESVINFSNIFLSLFLTLFIFIFFSLPPHFPHYFQLSKNINIFLKPKNKSTWHDFASLVRNIFFVLCPKKEDQV